MRGRKLSLPQRTQSLLQFTVPHEDPPPYMLGSSVLVPVHLSRELHAINRVTMLLEEMKGMLNSLRVLATSPLPQIANPFGTKGGGKKGGWGQCQEVFLRTESISDGEIWLDSHETILTLY